MIIGGNDISVPSFLPWEQQLQVCVDAIRLYWRSAVYQDADQEGCEAYPFSLAFSALRGLMVYKSQGSYESWRELGADPSNNTQLIYFLRSDGYLTIVIGDKSDDELGAIVSTITESLRDKATRMGGLRKAA